MDHIKLDYEAYTKKYKEFHILLKAIDI